MKRSSAFALTFATLLAAAPSAFAQSDFAVNLMAPPFNQPAPPKVTNDAQALAALHRRGVHEIGRLGQVGDYLEGEGRLQSKPVLAYVYENGATEVRPADPGALRQALNVLPPVAG